MAADTVTGKQYRTGLIAVFASSLINSVGGLLVRSIAEIGDWTIVFLRSGALACALLLVFTVRYRGQWFRQFTNMGWFGVLGAVFYGFASMSYVIALNSTTIANTTFILSSLPFMTAILAYLVLREKVRKETWIAMGVAAVGVAMMVYNGLSSGVLFGNMMALFTAFSFSSFVVLLRRGRNTNMLPALILGGMFSTVIGAIMMDHSAPIPTHDLSVCLIWGGLISAVINLMFLFGSRYVAGAEATLIILVEMILSPLWVWLVFAEQPAALTLFGGALVMSAVVGRALAGVRPKRRVAGG